MKRCERCGAELSPDDIEFGHVLCAECDFEIRTKMHL